MYLIEMPHVSTLCFGSGNLSSNLIKKNVIESLIKKIVGNLVVGTLGMPGYKVVNKNLIGQFTMKVNHSRSWPHV